MARNRIRRPNGAPEAPVRSVRVGNELWEKARRRADYEGLTMSGVLYAMVEGYAAGLLDMPKTQVVYVQPRPVVTEVPAEAS